jgi:hypothetical protein
MNSEAPIQLEALLARWQTSLDLHARYAALDDARYWHVQPWPRHERPQRWIIQLARKRILALQRLVAQRTVEGDRAFLEGIEIMGFLATLVGITSVERHIPLATPETERRDVLAARPEAPTARTPADTTRTRTAEQRRGAETTRQMPALATRASTARAATPARTAAPAPARRETRREPPRPAPTARTKKPATLTQEEHLVIADAVRLLGWGRQWHELADSISRLAERPAPSEIRRILRTFRAQIDAVAARRRE